MKAPGPTDRMLGRPGGARVLACLAGLAIYGAATDQVPWPVPILLVILTVAARQARSRVVAYDQWTGGWNELLGPHASSPTPARGRVPGVRLGRALARALLVFCALWLIARAPEHGVPPGACLAVLFGLALAGRLAVRRLPALRRFAGGSRAARLQEFCVRVCPPLPAWRARRPDVAQLPPYVLQLLRRPQAPRLAAPQSSSPSSPH